MTRTKLCDRKLPDYSRSVDMANMLTHAVGVAIGILVLVLSILTAAGHGNTVGIVGACIYGFSMIALYSVSSIYHGLLPGTGKKVMQVVDHCTIYLLIAGTYTPILLSAIRPEYPALAWIIFGLEWGCALLGTVFTAIDPNKYSKFSIACYLGMGWCIVLVLKATVDTIGLEGLLWLLAGGIAYTVGTAFYKIGKKKHIYHTVFHVFVDVASILQAVAVIQYAL